MKKSGLWIILFLAVTHLMAQTGNYIRIIVPEKDSTVIFAKYQRFNASTLPGSKVTINGEEFRVYPTGAFAGFIPLQPGINRLSVESVHPVKGKITKVIQVVFKAPVPEQAVTDFSIAWVRTVPPVSQSLVTGDVLQVRMKALPGCQALFFGNHPMYELPESQSGGIKGIYQGTYRIQPGDTLNQGKIDFTLLRNYPDNRTDAVHDVSVSATTNISR
ncbi:MAG TPA: hypothetical protein PLW67_06880, partial [Prolixibacteraceae bacterium]|nr:hypothetical protein [Prolixibacteraceae bacterium]